MKMDEMVLLLGRKNFLVQLSKEKFHTEFGIIDLSKIEKKKFGGKIKSHTDYEFTIAKPTLIDVLNKKAKRLPQIVMPDDAAMILATTGISPDSFIVDAGAGSGFLAIFLGYYCQRGKVVTYERNKKFAKAVEDNVNLVGLKNVQVKRKDVLKGISEKNVDLITLDLINAGALVDKARKVLKAGGWLVVYSPYIEQVKEIVKQMKKCGISHVKTIESIRRTWQIEDYTRPHTSGVMHTGWLTFGRKL